MANNAQIASSLTIVSSMLGFQAISLTEFTTSAQSVIAAGSKVEVGGAYFTWSAADTPQATTWTAIATAATAYITLTPSGAAGAQILTLKYSATAPEWSDSKQGWYLTAASIIRYIGGVTKAGTTQYDDAYLLTSKQENAARDLVIDNNLTVRNGFVANTYTELNNADDNNSDTAAAFNDLFNDVPSGTVFKITGFIVDIGSGRWSQVSWGTRTSATETNLEGTVVRVTTGSVITMAQEQVQVSDGDGKTYSWRVAW